MQEPQKSGSLFLAILILIALIVGGLLALLFIRPDKDNPAVIQTILVAITPIILGIIAAQNKQQTDRLDKAAVERQETSADVKELKSTVDGHLEKLVAGARAEGVKETTDANQRQAADAALIAEHEAGRVEGVLEGIARVETMPAVVAVPTVTTADTSSSAIVGEPVEVIIQQKGTN